MPGAVHVRGVEEGDAELERPPHRTHRLLVVDLTPAQRLVPGPKRTAERPRTHAHGADLEDHCDPTCEAVCPLPSSLPPQATLSANGSDVRPRPHAGFTSHMGRIPGTCDSPAVTHRCPPDQPPRDTCRFLGLPKN